MNGSRNRNDGQTMSVLFTMLLFLVFIMCALFTVLAGSKVYENISSRMDQTYTGSVAPSMWPTRYARVMRIRQWL